MRRAFGIVTMIAVLASAPACLAQQQSSQKNAYQEDYIRELRAVRTSPAAEYLKGVAALQARRYKVAIHALAKASDAAPNRPLIWRALGAAYAGEQRWVDSRRAYKRALYLAPDEIVSHAGLGLAMQALSDPKAQTQADWLKARAATCNNSCPDAALLKTLETRGPFARGASS